MGFRVWDFTCCCFKVWDVGLPVQGLAFSLRLELKVQARFEGSEFQIRLIEWFLQKFKISSMIACRKTCPTAFWGSSGRQILMSAASKGVGQMESRNGGWEQVKEKNREPSILTPQHLGTIFNTPSTTNLDSQDLVMGSD